MAMAARSNAPIRFIPSSLSRHRDADLKSAFDALFLIT
jgi:hypothetical protein